MHSPEIFCPPHLPFPEKLYPFQIWRLSRMKNSCYIFTRTSSVNFQSASSQEIPRLTITLYNSSIPRNNMKKDSCMKSSSKKSNKAVFKESAAATLAERIFHLSNSRTSVRTEILAGVTTFFTMAYILAVNPNIVSSAPGLGVEKGGLFIATALAAAAGTFLMAFFANYPFALAPGMGLNAFFTFVICGAMGYSWQFAFFAVFIEGLIFL